MLLGPLAFFVTWWGDCFDETCPSPTVIDNAAYVFDLVAGVAIGLLLIVVLFRPRRILFIVLGALAVAFAIEGIGGLLGSRGFYAFGIILPAALLLLLGAIAGFRVMSGTAAGWMRGRMAGALALGCATLLVAYLAFTVIAGAAGPVVVLVLVVVIVVPAAIVAIRRGKVSP